jgi:ribonuclease P protein component
MPETLIERSPCMPTRATLKKCEILRLKNDIDELFKEGKAVKVFPLKILYQVHSPSEPKPKLQVMFVVSKRAIKKATRRNRIKRCLREAYRLLKNDLLLVLSQQCPSVHHLRLAFLFQSAPSEPIRSEQMKAVLNRGIEKVIAQLKRAEL